MGFADLAIVAIRRRSNGNALFEFFRLEVRDQRIEHASDIPFEKTGQIVDGETDAVIGYPVLRKVVRPDLLAPVPRPNLAAPVLGYRFLLLLESQVLETRPQDAHSLGPILDL